MSSFLLPNSICTALDRLFKKNWWGFSKGKSRNLCLKSWSSMCTPRNLGGHGFRFMKATNLALAKLGWKITLVQSHLPLCSPIAPLNFWKALWKLHLNDRLRNFLYKIAWNILPTVAKLNAIFSSTTSNEYPLYHSAVDSLQHLFFNCIFVRVIWRHSFWPLDSMALSLLDMVE
jgi:hypothetical protein